MICLNSFYILYSMTSTPQPKTPKKAFLLWVPEPVHAWATSKARESGQTATGFYNGILREAMQKDTHAK